MADTHELRFGLADAQRAAESWRFNCGPASLCAVLGMTPDEVRPNLLDFERKGYVNPTLMASILRGLKVQFRRVYECRDKPARMEKEPELGQLGLCRIQWGGPWCKPGVPIAARYRKTHWIGYRQVPLGGLLVQQIFDGNALECGGWLSWEDWDEKIVPWIICEAVPKGDGDYWPTHVWEIIHDH